MIKQIINISLWSLGLLALIVFEIYALQAFRNTSCEKLKVELKNKKNYPLLTSSEEIRTEMLQNYQAIEGQNINKLNIRQIENKLSQISYLQRHEAYFTMNGNMAVSISPRKAILRVYNKSGQHFYLGVDTIVMPLSTQHSLRLLLANGALPKLNNSFFTQSMNDSLNLPDIYKKLYILAAKIHDDEFLNALIDQIYVRTDQEFELIPKVGVSYIEFGKIDNIDEKLKRLKDFYIKGKEKINWNIYKSINLKYDNQVVCTKK